MPVTSESSDKRIILRLEGDIGVASAADLKRLLIEAFAAAKEIQVSLDHAGDLDITVIQLLWTAAREAEKVGVSFSVSRLPESLGNWVREAGIHEFPGLRISGASGASSTVT